MKTHPSPAYYAVQKQGSPTYQQDRFAIGAVRRRSNEVLAKELNALIVGPNASVRTSGMGDKGGGNHRFVDRAFADGCLVCAHVGDSPIFVYGVTGGQQFTRLDKHGFVPHDVQNKLQIEALRRRAGGVQISGRFVCGPYGGLISITNSVGDNRFNLLCEPEIRDAPLKQNSPTMVVVASDGILPNGAGYTSYKEDINGCMMSYAVDQGPSVAEGISRSILEKSDDRDNVTVLVAIYDLACTHEKALVAGVFDGQVTDEVVSFLLDSFRAQFLSC